MATGALLVPPYIEFLDANGAPLVGGLVYFYAAGGTSTWQKVYSDSGLTTALPQPVVLDGAGRLMAYAQNLAYNVVVKTAVGATVWSQDNYLLAAPGGGGNTTTIPDWMTALIF